MSERKLGKALLGLDAGQLAGLPPAHEQTWKILQRDRRRVQWLTFFTIALWLFAVVLIFHLFNFTFYWNFTAKQTKLLQDYQRKFSEETSQQPDLNHKKKEAKKEPDLDTIHALHTSVLLKTVIIATVAMGVLALAALGTIVLVFVARRATLRQVNACLVEISEQLKDLKK
jgi:hypothetical protein